MRFEHRFKVWGKTAFPIDMLRYDNCRPATVQDSAKIARSQKQAPGELVFVELFSVTTDKNWRPAADRWREFGWVVCGHSRICLDVPR